MTPGLFLCRVRWIADWTADWIRGWTVDWIGGGRDAGALRLEGHQTITQRLFVTSDRTYKIRYQLQPRSEPEPPPGHDH